jgi:protein-tyrosine-phosphatase/predicted ATP-grasp superfamily ATP-dependent carboligase
MKNFNKIIRKIFVSLFRHEQWNIGIVDKPIWSFLENGKISNIQWLAKPKRNEFFADPFGIMIDGRMIVLYEHFNYHSFRGSISKLEVKNGKIISKKNNIFKLPFHASYPFLFQHEGQTYCIPESQERNGIDLYKAKKADLSEWEKFSTVIENFAGVDPTLIQYRGKFWLFCMDEKQGKNNQLFLFWAENLSGPWFAHKKNPVKDDITSSRPAGTPFVHNGELYRPTQDCSRVYGGRIAITKIKELTPDAFHEEVVKIIEMPKNSLFSKGMHTLSAVGDVTLIDAKRTIFSFGAFINVFKRALHKLLVKKNSIPRKKVLILGEDTRSFLSVIRSFGRKGFEVHVGWCPKASLALYSRYISKIHEIPAYSIVDNSWLDFFVNLIKKERYDLVIPCTDQTIFPLQKNRQLLEQYARIYLLDDMVFKIAFNKIKINEIARSLKINLPKEIVISNIAEENKIISNFDFPLVLKPEASFLEMDLENRNYPKIVFSQDELEINLRSMLKKGRVSVQEFFKGIGAGVEILANRGEILVAFQHERVHEPSFGGASSYRRSAAISPELMEAAKKLIKNLNYTGIAMLEFKINPESKQWIFIELNSRFWGSLPVAEASGIDFPFYLYELLIENKSDFPQEYRKGIYVRNLWQDVNWLKNNFQADKSNPYLIKYPIKKIFFEIGNILKLKEKSDTLVFDDLVPGIREISRLSNLFLDLFHKKVFVKILSLDFVRKIYAKKIINNKKSIKEILFICKGNICRSPFAEAYAKKKFPQSLCITSGGYFPQSGRKCPEEAMLTGNKFEVSLENHSSKLVTADMVSKVDKIFVFDTEDYAMTVSKFPQEKRKVNFLGVFGKKENIIIGDPFGKKLKGFEDCYSDIAESIDNFYEKMYENIRNK